MEGLTLDLTNITIQPGYMVIWHENACNHLVAERRQRQNHARRSQAVCAAMWGDKTALIDIDPQRSAAFGWNEPPGRHET